MQEEPLVKTGACLLDHALQLRTRNILRPHTPIADPSAVASAKHEPPTPHMRASARVSSTSPPPSRLGLPAPRAEACRAAPRAARRHMRPCERASGGARKRQPRHDDERQHISRLRHSHASSRACRSCRRCRRSGRCRCSNASRAAQRGRPGGTGVASTRPFRLHACGHSLDKDGAEYPVHVETPHEICELCTVKRGAGGGAGRNRGLIQVFLPSCAAPNPMAPGPPGRDASTARHAHAFQPRFLQESVPRYSWRACPRTATEPFFTSRIVRAWGSSSCSVSRRRPQRHPRRRHLPRRSHPPPPRMSPSSHGPARSGWARHGGGNATRKSPFCRQRGGRGRGWQSRPRTQRWLRLVGRAGEMPRTGLWKVVQFREACPRET